MARSKEKMSSDQVVGRLKNERLAAGICLGLVVAGLGLLIAGEKTSGNQHETLDPFLNDLAALLIVSATLGFLWEFFGKRSFAREVLAAAGVAADVRAAGLQRITTDYLGGVPWSKLFRDAKEIDLLVSWGATWRRTHEANWDAWIGQSNVSLRVLLPTPNDEAFVEHLADRFNKTPNYVREKVTEARNAYEQLATRAQEGSSVEVRYIKRAPVWGYYRFGASVVATLYPHSLESAASVPSLLFDRVGQGGDFFFEQFQLCWDEAEEG